MEIELTDELEQRGAEVALADLESARDQQEFCKRRIELRERQLVQAKQIEEKARGVLHRVLANNRQKTAALEAIGDRHEAECIECGEDEEGRYLLRVKPKE